MKLVEAFLWLDRAPDAGDVCVDLGAAPGGWTWVLLERRARVIAVDPALPRALAAGQARRRAPARATPSSTSRDEPVDWLFCDMAWRPLESAALLAKWARRGWARLLIANIKLPMKKKAEILVRVREILTDGGWTQPARAPALPRPRRGHDRAACASRTGRALPPTPMSLAVSSCRWVIDMSMTGGIWQVSPPRTVERTLHAGTALVQQSCAVVAAVHADGAVARQVRLVARAAVVRRHAAADSPVVAAAAGTRRPTHCSPMSQMTPAQPAMSSVDVRSGGTVRQIGAGEIDQSSCRPAAASTCPRDRQRQVERRR